MKLTSLRDRPIQSWPGIEAILLPAWTASRTSHQYRQIHDNRWSWIAETRRLVGMARRVVATVSNPES